MFLSALMDCHVRTIRDYGGFRVSLYFRYTPFILSFIIRKMLCLRYLQMRFPKQQSYLCIVAETRK